jgi:hypothetical protein
MERQLKRKHMKHKHNKSTDNSKLEKTSYLSPIDNTCDLNSPLEKEKVDDIIIKKIHRQSVDDTLLTTNNTNHN